MTEDDRKNSWLQTLDLCGIEHIHEHLLLVEEIGLDEIGLALLVMNLQRSNPYFSLPDQMDTLHLTLADVRWYFSNMGPDHEAISER